jgi:hypothetical protein
VSVECSWSSARSSRRVLDGRGLITKLVPDAIGSAKATEDGQWLSTCYYTERRKT